MFDETLFEEKVTPRTFVPSGIATLDRALKGGLWLASAYEIYGFTHVGKSTFAYYLASKVRPNGVIALADFEHFDPAYLASCVKLSGFTGKVRELPIDDGETAVDAMRNALYDENVQAVILDSVGALIPKAEIEGKITDANMGVKPRLMARGIRLCIHALKYNQACLFLINHLHPIMTLGSAHTTSGGVAVQNYSAVRIKLHPKKSDDGYVIVQGHLDKNRWGGKADGDFWFVIIPSIGIHPGLCAVQDAIGLGLATDDRTIKLGDTSYGYFSKLVEKAVSGDDEVFVPFKEAVDGYLRTGNKP